MTRIIQASEAREFADAAMLIRAYLNYILHMGFTECIAGNLHTETADLNKIYPASEGGVFVAYIESEPAGVVALERQAKGIAEIRRLYVDEKFRGKQLGEQLIAKVVDHAQLLGYHTVRLDTFRAVHYAAAVYRKLGFKEIAPYNNLPSDKVIFMEYNL